MAANNSNHNGRIPARTGGKLGRSETVTVRLDPKLRYLAELGARRQRRTLSSFVESAIDSGVRSIQLSEGGYNAAPTNIGDMADSLWDVDESDRFAKLAFRYPDLLDYAQQALWKLICETPGLWRAHCWREEWDDWTWDIKEDNFEFQKLRENWEKFNEVGRGDAPRSDLPEWCRAIRECETHVSVPEF